ncbi:MAG: glycerate kinase [Acidimicrobiia bacterium]|nr:glycerate kinase [Acidimicrobiia bacterium]
MTPSSSSDRASDPDGDSGRPVVVLAFDKFRGTATSADLGEAAAEAARNAGWDPRVVPLADGGEGTLDVLGGPNKVTRVTGPLGRPVDAPWRLDGREAFIEMAAASGLQLAGGADGNDPLEASTVGTGQLIATAVELGAKTVYVFVGGSATTDGGLGAIRALGNRARMREISLIVGCDVDTRFTEAARVFGPQKGATRAHVELLTRRLERLVQLYREEFEVDVSEIPGGGAAGGLAGGLCAVGARLQSGFEILAEKADLDLHLAEASMCVTGEGKLDQQSFDGKVVGGIFNWCRDLGVPTAAVVGMVAEGTEPPDELTVRALVDRYGTERAMGETVDLVADEVAQILAERSRI